MGSRTHEQALVLVHSPLIGPTSWLPVAHALERRGRAVVVPTLRSVADAPAPQRDIPDTVQLATSHLQGPIILVGHSGAGLLLPVIAEALTAEVTALIFVDSFLPPAAGPVELAPTAFMDQLRSIATDGVLPPWSRWFGDDTMRELVHDEDLRAALESEMPRLPLTYFESAVLLPEDWLRRPCAYLLLSPDTYRQSAAKAEALGWPVRAVRDAHHLSIATDPIPVTEALLELEHCHAQPPRSQRRR
jgi:pimeloyl-ACP methyl ester carboxylesterase